MPSVARFGGLRVAIYPNDHGPAHLHVIGAGGEAVIDLNCPKGPVELREVYGFSRSDIRPIKDGRQQRLADLCAAWEKVHGEP